MVTRHVALSPPLTMVFRATFAITDEDEDEDAVRARNFTAQHLPQYREIMRLQDATPRE